MSENGTCDACGRDHFTRRAYGRALVCAACAVGYVVRVNRTYGFLCDLFAKVWP